MTPDRWQEALVLFDELVELEAVDCEARLAVVSDGDAELASGVVSLLAADEEADAVLGPFEQLVSEPGFEALTPASLEAWPGEAEALVGQGISRYRVLKRLGAGGMGVLYLAEDQDLGRTVVLKLIQSQWVDQPALKERFVREARAAAALEHPNICTIHEVGETDEGRPFIAMAFYEGETVKEKIERGPLPEDEALDLARQAASGLSAAHESGIVHRDIKPANLIVTKDGVLKILDFGLAKTEDIGLTGPGLRLGTVAYMSPEQTRGEEITPSTDLWSLGVVLYEMMTGRRPFRADNDHAVINAIRHDEPTAPGKLRDGLPPDVENMLLQLLSKEPQARVSGAEWLLDGRTPAEFERWLGEIHRRSLWQVLVSWAVASWLIYVLAGSLADSVGLPLWFGRAALLVLALGLPVLLLTAFVQPQHRKDLGMGSEQPGITRFLTWRNALLGGVAAFALLGIGTAGYMAMRSLGIGPAGTLIAGNALEEGARLVLVDFAGAPEDSALARTVTEALRIDLSQSRAVTLAEPGQVRRILGQMERPEDAPLDLETAREVAVRGGMAAVIGGAVRRVGDRYVLTAQVVAAEEGKALVSRRETAAGEQEIIPALDRLSTGLRERIGESLTTIRASPPLEAVTTSSLEAVRKYAEAVRAHSAGEGLRSLDLLEEAVALDTTFAMAWRQLGIYTPSPSRKVEAFTKAFELRDRLTDRERYVTTATYYSLVLGDRPKAINALRTLLESYPDDPLGNHNLAGFYAVMRDYAAAETHSTHAAQLDPAIHPMVVRSARAAVVEMQVAQGRIEEARATLDRYQAEGGPLLEGNPPSVGNTELLFASSQGDYETAEAQARALRDENPRLAMRHLGAQVALAELHLLRGQLAEAERFLQANIADNAQLGFPQWSYGMIGCCPMTGAIGLAMIEVWFRADPDGAVFEMEKALDRFPLDSMAVLDRRYRRLASFYALAGQVEQARDLAARYEATFLLDPRRRGQSETHAMLGDVALAEGRYVDALAEYRLADQTTGSQVRVLGPLGRAYEVAGQPDSAIAVYERYVTLPQLDRLHRDAQWLGFTLERLGALYDEQGDLEKAAEHYARFVELWKDADPELQPRVQAAQERLDEIVAQRG